MGVERLLGEGREVGFNKVFQTYETKWRGIEAMLPTLHLLDLTAYGRQETREV